MSGLTPTAAVALSAVLVASSAFFVAVELALVAVRRHRLEEAARSSSAARAALRASRSLPLVLAGSHLGITLCLVVLGAVTLPAVHGLLTPVLELTGLPGVAAAGLAFPLALALVTFVHLVASGRAPRSWALADPERSAIMLAPPMRGFLWLTRPILLGLDGAARWCLRRVGVEPVAEVAGGPGPDDLRALVDHSVEAGALDEGRRDRLATALELNARPVREAVTPADQLAGVAPDASAAQIRAAARRTGHLRLVVRAGDRPLGMVHVRDALTAAPGTTAADLMRPVLHLDASTPIYRALSTMRESRRHLALVGAGGTLLGLVTLQDLLDELLRTQGAPA